MVRVALVGPPNSGKTTLFNWLTGSKVRPVNYAGSTVDALRGTTLPQYGEPLEIIDTPGAYSLRPHGRDEEVTLAELNETKNLRLILAVVDGTQLNRQLYLVRQLQTLGIPLVLAVTMMDLVRKSARHLDLEKLAELVEVPVVGIEGRLGGGVADLVEVARARAESISDRTTPDLDWSDARIESEIAIAEEWTRAASTVREGGVDALSSSAKLDRVFLHPVWGVVIFTLVMATLFSSIFWLAAPLMGLVDYAFTALAHGMRLALGTGVLADFLAGGIVPGFAAVLIFVPQIFILFLFFTLLEDSGYLARAATIVDGPINNLGLSGRAFVPLLSGFACAVPAIMACRNLRSVRERWITILIIPFMTCSARLPVYTLLLAFLFSGSPSGGLKAGLALTALYLGGLILGAVAAVISNRIKPPGQGSTFLLELPIYRLPKWIFTFRVALRRTRSYLVKAGPTIFCFVLALWMGTHFPHEDKANPAERLQRSAVGRVGSLIEPVFRPLGLDGRVGLGMMSAFVAREVFVSSMAVIFSLVTDEADAKEDGLRESLLERMRDAKKPDQSLLFTTSSVVGLIVYFMIALQCLSTTGIVWRETGSWKFAAGQLLAFNVLAYVVAVGLVQGLRALGLA